MYNIFNLERYMTGCVYVRVYVATYSGCVRLLYGLYTHSTVTGHRLCIEFIVQTELQTLHKRDYSVCICCSESLYCTISLYIRRNCTISLWS